MRRLRLSLLALVASLVLAEVCLKLWYPIGGLTYRLDGTYLHGTIPGSRRLQPMPARAGGGRNLIEIGPEGYRGQGLDGRGERPRLVVVGDSLVMAENVAYHETLAERLEEHLDGAFDVVGVGASGFGPDQALLRLEAEWETLKPDRVLLVLCATNDHGDVVRNKLCRLTETGELAWTRWSHGADVLGHFEAAQGRADDLGLVRLWRAFSESRARDRALAGEALAGPQDLTGAYLEAGAQEWADHMSGSPVVHDLFRDYYDADLAVAPRSSSALGKKALMAALMGRWAESLGERDVPLSVLVVPSAVDLDPSFHIRVIREAHPDYDPRAQTEAFEQACSAAGVAVRGLYDLFEDNGPSELFVGHDDIHWNARGIDLAARDVAGWLRGE